MAIYTVSKRVKAEYKPYLILDRIDDLTNLDKCIMYISRFK